MVIICLAICIGLSILGAFFYWVGLDDPSFGCFGIAIIFLVIAIAVGIFFGVALVNTNPMSIEAEITAIENKVEATQELIRSLGASETADVYAGSAQYTQSSLLRDQLREVTSGLARIEHLRRVLARREVWLHGFILPW